MNVLFQDCVANNNGAKGVGYGFSWAASYNRNETRPVIAWINCVNCTASGNTSGDTTNANPEVEQMAVVCTPNEYAPPIICENTGALVYDLIGNSSGTGYLYTGNTC
jgi:hypothetical protein